MKRHLFILLALVAFGTGAFAQNYNVWDGHTTTRPEAISIGLIDDLNITSAAELAYIREHWDETSDYGYTFDKPYYQWSYILEADIDMGDDVSWIPFGQGTFINKYEGEFDGQGHTIRINIHGTDNNCQGLFAGISSTGQVHNLHVAGIIDVGNARLVGGISGENDGLIENCWVSADVKSSHYNWYSDADIGGITGLNENGTIRFCCMTGNVTNTGGNSGVGGLVGSNESTIEHCTFYGAVSVNHSQHSIYVGDDDGFEDDLYFEYYDVHYDYGSSNGMNMYCQAYKYPYAININIVGNGTLEARVDGAAVTRTIGGKYVELVKTSGTMEELLVRDADGYEMYFGITDTLDFTMPHRDVNVSVAFNTTDWNDPELGSEGNPYIINQIAEWNDFANHVYNGNTYSGKYVKLTADISISGMVGTPNHPFSGHFDGGGHIINCYIDKDDVDYVAPFSVTQNATFKDLTITGNVIIGGNHDYLAGIVGQARGTTRFTNCKVSSTLECSNSSSSVCNGGFVGEADNVTFINCVFNGQLLGSNATYCAGFVGQTVDAATVTLSNCLFAPSAVTFSETGACTFVRSDNSFTLNINNNNCFYTQTFGAMQGQHVVTTEPTTGFYTPVTAADGVAYYWIIGTESGSSYSITCNLTVPTRISAKGDIELNLGQGTTLNAPKGICLAEGDRLTINGPGTLTINNCDQYKAGIETYGMGELIINGGVINTTGGRGAAGIGGNSEISGSTVTINGGVVNATGGAHAAGIGGNYRRVGSTVTINGGVVNASGGAWSPGIGSGADDRAEAEDYPCGNVVINGGKVTAIGQRANGIGPSYSYNQGSYHNGTLRLGWTNADDDFVYISKGQDDDRNLESITFAEGKQFYLEHTALIATESNLYNYKLIPYTGTLPHLEGEGTAESPYLISNNEDWTLFRWFVNSGTKDYSGEYVKLTTMLTISTMVGENASRSFSGTFLGNGQTLKFNYNPNVSETGIYVHGIAPFHYIKNATIQDLIIRGAIYSAGNYTAGLVGYAEGTNLILRCIVRPKIKIHEDYAGGIVGHGKTSHTTIQDCEFLGSIEYYEIPSWHAHAPARHNIGGIWGWNDTGSEPVLVNCLEKGTYENILTFHPIGLMGDAGSVTNCYYINPRKNSPEQCCTNNGAANRDYHQAYTTAPTGEISKRITINTSTVYSAACTLSGVESFYESSASITPVVQDPFNNSLVLGTDFTLTLNGNPVTEFPININAGGKYTLTFTGTGNYTGTKSIQFGLVSPFEQSGTETDPYLIYNVNDWYNFSQHISHYDNTFSGHFVKLMDDINIDAMAGVSKSISFQGTFDGNGHTLTLSGGDFGTLSSYISSSPCAPFRYVAGATIRNLSVAGDIYTSSQFASGLIGTAGHGDNVIHNCIVSVNIHSSRNGDGTHGGFIALLQGENGQQCLTTFTGCAFTGSITTTNNTTSVSGFVGWCEYNNSGHCLLVFNDCFVKPGAACIPEGSKTYARCRSEQNSLTINGRCYYTQTIGDAQGLQVFNDGTEPIGSYTYYNVSGLKVYANGVEDSSDTFYNNPNVIYREITGYGNSTGSDHWAFIASPVNGSIAPTEVGNLLGTQISDDPVLYNYDLYRLNPSTVRWENYHQHTADFNIVNGRGYLYATAEDKTLVFQGTYNTGTEMVIDNLPQGYNLVGNPFTVDAYVDKSYYTLNGDGSIIVAEPVSVGTAIPPCYGVIVEVGEEESVTFSTSAPAQQNANNGSLQIAVSQVVEPVETPSRNGNGLKVGPSTGSGTEGSTTATLVDNAIVSFNEGTKLGKFYFGTQNANIYIPQDGKDYAITFSEGQGEMPLNFKATKNGEYTLTVNPENMEMNYLHLIDNMTGADIDLLTTTSYTFESKTTDYESRFKLVFATNDENGSSTGSETFAFISNGNLIVSGTGTLQVIDATGRQLISKEVHSSLSLSTSNLTAGVYVLRLIGEDLKMQKIILK